MLRRDSEGLAGWSVLCLRPSTQQAAVRRAVRARGGVHVALPGLGLVPMPDQAAAGAALVQALAAVAVVFTSPAAVSFAARLRPLQTRAVVFAVGAGTARALARHGIQARYPAADAMHSEGLLALPQWQGLHGRVGVVTAPGGRGVIVSELARRGFELCVAEVYRRVPPRLDARHHAALAASTSPRAVLVSSGEALDAVRAALPPPLQARFLDALAVCSSTRLLAQARQAGFAQVLQAPAATVAAMLDALVGQIQKSPKHAADRPIG